VTGSATTLTLTAAATAVAGRFAVSVTGTNAAEIHTAPIALSVAAPGTLDVVAGRSPNLTLSFVDGSAATAADLDAAGIGFDPDGNLVIGGAIGGLDRVDGSSAIFHVTGNGRGGDGVPAIQSGAGAGTFNRTATAIDA